MKPLSNPLPVHRLAIILLLAALVALAWQYDAARQEAAVLRTALALNGQEVREAQKRAENAERKVVTAQNDVFVAYEKLGSVQAQLYIAERAAQEQQQEANHQARYIHDLEKMQDAYRSRFGDLRLSKPGAITKMDPALYRRAKEAGRDPLKP